MAGGYAWSRRAGARVRTLRGLVADTQRALHDVRDILAIEPEVNSSVQEIGNASLRSTALVVLGASPRARVRLLHCLLGRRLLPEDMPRGCRWIRIQYGSSTQVHLSLGNSEFELVEDLECNKRAWDVLPVEDLIRQDSIDLTTILEVEINNQFLKDGLRILIPPDIATEPAKYNHVQLKNIHSEFYSKRSSILKNFNCVYLYAVDKMGKNIYSDNICGNFTVSKSQDDFWNSFSLYTGSVRCDSAGDDGDEGGDKVGDDERVVWTGSEGGEPAVFSSENCLDLHQMKEVSPPAQPLFLLFGDATEQATGAMMSARESEATESAGDAICTDELPEEDIEMAHRLRDASESPEPKQACDKDKQRLVQEQVAFMNDLLDQWELMTNPPQKHYIKSQWAILNDAELMRTVDLKHAPAYAAPAHSAGETCVKGRRDDKVIKSRSVLLSAIVRFATETLQSYLLEFCTRLGKIHIKLLQQFIAASFSLARELQVVPKKIQYVAIHEQNLYEMINKKFSEGDKKEELLEMMHEVLQEMKTDINNMDWSVDDLPCHQDIRFATSTSTFYCSTLSYPSLPLSPIPSRSLALSPSLSLPEAPSDGEEAASYDSYNLEEYDIIGQQEESYSDCYASRIEDESSSPPPTNILVENETEMFSLSHTWAPRAPSDASCCGGTNVSLKHATADVQQTVLARLSRKISLKLVKFFDCLKESYFGTLQRCLESLETSCRQELGGKPASEAMRQLLSVGRQVELQPNAAFSLLRTLLDNLRRLFNKLSIVGSEEQACCALSPAWRRRVARHTLHSLSAQRLARIISAQIISRLSAAHERYQSALATLEAALASRLHHTEDVKLAIRKKYAPSFARLCLESTSMCDLLMYGTPELGREIGRGQYGVVYSARGGWGGRAPVAVKSVLPADERHYHELAMEFVYTRSIPLHPRIVRLYGSIVQRAGGAGAGAGAGAGGARCVLLVSARHVRDLHAAVRAGLSLPARMRIACDIVEGIRYLHSQGLVHRDIKLKNVLLDAANRAALSDLGFCAAGALMSGSVVGTPVHMAPELLAGDYCSAVDVYAFGILFWYLCAGDVKLPAAFELFNNKEQLWSKVKKGLRPERLPQFSDASWAVMEACWRADPAQRPLLGDVQQQLNAILEHAIANETVPCVQYHTDDDCLDMTGLDNFDM